MLSKAMVVGIYQRKAELIARDPGIDLTVAVPPLWRDEGLERRLERRHLLGYRLVETPIFRPGSFHLHCYPAFGRLLDAHRPALVHVDEEPYNLATFLALASARRRGARSLFFTWQNLNRRYPPPFGWMERWVYRRVGGAIAGSQGAAAVLRAKGFLGPLWVIPQFGVDTEAFQPMAGEAGGPPGGLRIGFAGRLVRAKGADLAIEALARMQPGQAASLEIVGEGPERAGLEAMARGRGLGARVRFRPWLPSGEMPAFYRGLDVLVLPSRSTPRWIEQFGRVLIEAMASGVVCVGSDSGEIPQVIGPAGLIVPEDDTVALAGALERLAAEPALRARLAAEGRARALAEFSMERVAAATVAVYRALAPAPPATQPG